MNILQGKFVDNCLGMSESISTLSALITYIDI